MPGPPSHGPGRPFARPVGRFCAFVLGALVLVLTALVLTAVGAAAGVLAVGTPGAGAATTPRTAPAHPTAAPALALDAQSATVAPGQALTLDLRPGAGISTAGLGVSVSVYECLSTVSAFDQSLDASGPTGSRIASTTSPIPLAGLPTTTGGAFALSMPVKVGAGGQTGSTFVIDLTAADGQCQGFPSGVYPVRVQLVQTAGGRVVGSLTTHLVYGTPPASTQKLRVAVVLPVRLPQPAARPTTAELAAHPTAALSTPRAADLDRVAGVVGAVADHPGVPLTLDASPQTVSTLADTGHQASVDQLAGLAAQPAAHQLAVAPYVPVDAAGLVDAGLDAELSRQVSRGAGILAAELLHTTAAAASATAPGAGRGAWLAGGDSLDTATLAQLQADGYARLVVPGSSLASSPDDGSAAQPFTLATGRSTPITALAADSDLSARFTDAPGDPVLAAHHLVAELAQIYYEKPNDSSVRSVVVTAPAGWNGNAAFADALLGSLAGNPLLQAVTVDDAFADTAPGTCRGGCRLAPLTGTSGLPASAIRTQRNRDASFAAAAPAARAVSADLSDLILSGEASDLRPAQQAAVLHGAGAALDAQLDQLVVSGDRSITLTSRKGRIPVAIQSGAGYPVTAAVTLTSDKLLFSDGTTQWTTTATLLPSHTNVIYVTVQARTSGLFRMAVTLHSLTGGLLLSSGEVSVRSTASSVVGVVLSVGAVVVLAAWWFRTSRKRRDARRREEAETEADVAGEAGAGPAAGVGPAGGPRR